jgi:hypothetical protein
VGNNDGADRTGTSQEEPRLPRWARGAVWTVLGLIFLLLISVAARLLISSGFFSGTAPTDAQRTSLWGFLGVALGAAATLLGALLTDQHNRRTHALAQEAEHRARTAQQHQRELDKQSANRLALDTVSQLLTLMGGDGTGSEASRAQMAGAVATMMELRSGAVAVRVLGELWATDKVDADTAVWLADRVLEDPPRPLHGTREEQEAKKEAVYAVSLLLYRNADKLFPSEPITYWPRILRDNWPQELPENVRGAFLATTVRALLSKSPRYWTDAYPYPIYTLNQARKDPFIGREAAGILLQIDRSDPDGAIGLLPQDIDRSRLEEESHGWLVQPWLMRLIEGITPWVGGHQSDEPPVESAPVISASPSGADAGRPAPSKGDPTARGVPR